MKIDCLCITTSRRKKFKNWLLWNYLKQNYANKELIVISDDDDWPEWVTFVHTGINESIPVKRNIALATADGDAITWFDDDDWQHVNKLKIISDHVDKMINVGSSTSFFFDIFTRKIKLFDMFPKPIFNSIGVARYGLPAFNENKPIASDTDWLNKLDYRGNYITETMLFFWITHNDNISNPRNKIRATDQSVYFDGDTWQQLRKLEANLKLG